MARFEVNNRQDFEEEEDKSESAGSYVDVESEGSEMEDPDYDLLEETQCKLSTLSTTKKSTSRYGGVLQDPEVDQKSYEKVVEIVQGGQLERLKVEQCKVYLRNNGLRLTGNKETLIRRIQDHQEIFNGLGEKKYPASSFVINCKGDACTGDIVMFEQNVYELYSVVSRSASGPPCGTRIIAGRIVRESYGAAKQQHTFTIEVLWSKGEKPLPPLHPLLVKGRNLYRLKTLRQRWEDEEERKKVLMEKHSRGTLARCARETRIQEKEMRKIQREKRVSKEEKSNWTEHHPNPICQPYKGMKTKKSGRVNLENVAPQHDQLSSAGLGQIAIRPNKSCLHLKEREPAPPEQTSGVLVVETKAGTGAERKVIQPLHLRQFTNRVNMDCCQQLLATRPQKSGSSSNAAYCHNGSQHLANQSQLFFRGVEVIGPRLGPLQQTGCQLKQDGYDVKNQAPHYSVSYDKEDLRDNDVVQSHQLSERNNLGQQRESINHHQRGLNHCRPMSPQGRKPERSFNCYHPLSPPHRQPLKRTVNDRHLESSLQGKDCQHGLKFSTRDENHSRIMGRHPPMSPSNRWTSRNADHYNLDNPTWREYQQEAYPISPRRGYQSKSMGVNHPMSPLLRKMQSSSNSFRPSSPPHRQPLRSVNHCRLMSSPRREAHQKEQLCKYYGQGRCYFGDQCKFLHQE